MAERHGGEKLLILWQPEMRERERGERMRENTREERRYTLQEHALSDLLPP
jgi:hypothetical protein